VPVDLLISVIVPALPDLLVIRTETVQSAVAVNIVAIELAE